MLVFCTLIGCYSSSEINGSSIKTAHRSVNYIKNHLSVEQRIEFEIAYWTIRDFIKNTGEFLDAVDGKDSAATILLGKEIFQQHKNNGFADYAEFTSWDQMIAKYYQKRLDADKNTSNFEKNKINNVLYNL